MTTITTVSSPFFLLETPPSPPRILVVSVEHCYRMIPRNWLSDFNIFSSSSNFATPSIKIVASSSPSFLLETPPTPPRIVAVFVEDDYRWYLKICIPLSMIPLPLLLLLPLRSRFLIEEGEILLNLFSGERSFVLINRESAGKISNSTTRGKFAFSCPWGKQKNQSFLLFFITLLVNSCDQLVVSSLIK